MNQYLRLHRKMLKLYEEQDKEGWPSEDVKKLTYFVARSLWVLGSNKPAAHAMILRSMQQHIEELDEAIKAATDPPDISHKD